MALLRICVTVIAAVAALPLLAFDLTMPGNAVMTREIERNPDSYLVPIGPWADGAIPVLEIEGRIVTQAWRLEVSEVTSLQILDGLAAQLEKAGFSTLLRCKGQVCGGFDFRFGTEVIAAPDMFVDLFDYYFLSARRGQDAGADYVTLLVSRSNRVGFVQIVHATTSGATSMGVTSQGGGVTTRPVLRPGSDTSATQSETGSHTLGQGIGQDTDQRLDQALLLSGHTVLSDLEFTSGASTLGPGPFASLGALAVFLKADKTRRVALVGHTDTTGGLEPNIALSRKRANAVLERLVGAYGISRAQLEANGMGYLSPIASNLTATGRESNRRVEAVLLNTK